MAQFRARQKSKDKQTQHTEGRAQKQSRNPEPGSREASVSALQNAVGNQTTTDALTQPGGRPLRSETQAEMERAYGADFSDVRIHDDTAAHTSAEAISAEAFTHGNDIYLDRDVPSSESPQGKELLAHELAHVVQQRQATGGNESPLSEPGDQFEQAADHAAHQALQGQEVATMPGGNPPTIQRQERRPIPRSQVENELRAFLTRELQVQGGRSLRVTDRVRNAVRTLFIDDVRHLITIDAWLSSPALPGDPAEFARQVARRLPDTVDPARLQSVKRLSGPAPRPSTLGRIGALVESTAAGSAESQAEEEAGQIARGEIEPPSGPAPGVLPLPSTEPSIEERTERTEGIERTIRGEEEPTTIGPVQIPLLRLGRIISGLPEAIRGPGPRRAPEPTARTYPQVQQVIQQLSPNALIPAEARGTSKADSFADAQVLTQDLARRLDIAHQQGQERIVLRLGDNYSRVRDRSAMASEVERIVRLIRDALPHRASNVRHVDVFFGNRLVRRVTLSEQPAQ